MADFWYEDQECDFEDAYQLWLTTRPRRLLFDDYSPAVRRLIELLNNALDVGNRDDVINIVDRLVGISGYLDGRWESSDVAVEAARAMVRINDLRQADYLLSQAAIECLPDRIRLALIRLLQGVVSCNRGRYRQASAAWGDCWRILREFTGLRQEGGGSFELEEDARERVRDLIFDGSRRMPDRVRDDLLQGL